MLVFELQKGSGGDYFVRVVYNGKQIALSVLTPASIAVRSSLPNAVRSSIG